MHSPKHAHRDTVTESPHYGHSRKNSVDVKQETRPAVYHELIEEKEHESVTHAVDREIHQHHHQIYIQPVTERIVEDEKHIHRTAPVEHRTRHHGKDREVASALAQERGQFRNTYYVVPASPTTSSHNTLVGEHIHHHVHNIIQPVIERQRVVPHIVHTTVPIHEHIEHEPYIHKGTVLPAITLDEFLKRGYSLDGSKQPSGGASVVYEGKEVPPVNNSNTAGNHVPRGRGYYANSIRGGSPIDAYEAYTGRKEASPVAYDRTTATATVNGRYDNRARSPAAVSLNKGHGRYGNGVQGASPPRAYSPVDNPRATAAGLRVPGVPATDGYRNDVRGSPNKVYAPYTARKESPPVTVQKPIVPRLQVPDEHGGYASVTRGASPTGSYSRQRDASPVATNRAAASALQVPGGLGGRGGSTRGVSPAASATSFRKNSYPPSEMAKSRRKSAESSRDTDTESRAARSVYREKEREDKKAREEKGREKEKQREAEKTSEKEKKENRDESVSPTSKKHSWLSLLNPRHKERSSAENSPPRKNSK
ncbi:hypothetical protein TWF696_006941 [Orbilia brochopaga]|uniref:Uncharacterized protein n=1 Tax=Orbilia brochopaga TaxID=3140254 RepID=A0AAV9UR43_9PEZI